MPSVFAALAGLAMPACGYRATGGLPEPVLLDMAHIVRPSTPNTALAAPAGFSPAPDLVTRPYGTPPARLFALVRQVALAQPRTFLHAEFAEPLQAHFVARSRVWNFPDLIAAQILPDGGLVLWSRSVYGHSDLGVNRARLKHWLAALDRATQP